jgi:hypothetical protein
MNKAHCYKPFKEAYEPESPKEKFFVSYAVRGPTNALGIQKDMPVNHPISGQVKEPSPLNTRCMYSAPGWNSACIL